MSSILPPPLAGIVVLELAGIGPAPFAGMMLRQLGARVILVERPTALDSIIASDRNATHDGKERVQLDLKDQAGVTAFLDLVGTADVVIEAHRPGVMERLGLGPDVLLRHRPQLVYGRMTGWGQDGPWAKSAGHDLNYIAITGALHTIGPKDGPPQIPLNLLGDYAGGALYLVVGLLAALHDVARGRLGRVVDAAIVDGVSHLLSAIHGAMSIGQWKDERESNFADGGTPFYAVYETKDGKYMTVTAVEAPFYRIFLTLLGIDADPARQYDENQWPALRRKIADAFHLRTRTAWETVFAGTDACVAPVLSLREAANHPHIAARGAIACRDGNPFAAPAPRFGRP